MYKLGNQRLSYAEKTANDNEWGKEQVDAIISFEDSYNSVDYDRMLSNYRLYNNIIDQDELRKECNPLNIQVGQFESEIKPYNKTYNKIQVLLGEEAKRPFNFKALLINPTGARRKLEQKKEMIKAQLTAMFQKELQPEDPNNQQPPAESLEDLERYLSTRFLSMQEIKVSQILKYIIKKERIKDKRNDSFKHGAISGMEPIWVGIRNGEPVVEVLNSLGFFFRKSPETKYIQDGFCAGYRTRLSVRDIIDRYHEDLSDEDIAFFYEKLSGLNGIDPDIVGKEMRYKGYNKSFETRYYGEGHARSRLDEGSYLSENDNYSDDYEVIHVEWVSETKIGFLTVPDEFGELVVKLVGEDFPTDEAEKIKYKNEFGNTVTTYVFPDGTSLVWDYIPEVWEGTKIGENKYVNVRPKPDQYRSIENPYSVKLGYHGVIYSSMNAPAVSLMDRMKPYQFLYILAIDKFKKLIARDRGKTMPIDTSTLDPEMNLEKTLYYLEELDYEIYNSLAVADGDGMDGALAHSRGKEQIKDRSNISNIVNYIQILEYLENMIGEAAGVTKQREGQIQTYDTVGGTQQSIVQSSHITEPYFALHDHLWAEVLSSIVQTAQVAWSNKSIVKQYVLDDGTIAMLNLEGNEIDNESFGVFISNNSKDFEVFETLRQLTQPLIQNNKIEITDVIKILSAESPQELERELTYAINKKKAQEQQMQQEMQQQQIDAQAQNMQAQIEHEINLHEMDNDTKIKVAEIQAFSRQIDQDINNNGVPDQLEIEKLRLENDKFTEDTTQKEKDRALKEKELKVKKAQANKKPK